MPRPLWLFSLVNLVIGTGAFVTSGILTPLAKDLGVSVPAAGQAMTAYALSTALLAPLVLLATGRWSRKRALLLALALFAAGNVLCALAGSLTALLVSLLGATMALLPLTAGSWPLMLLVLLAWGTAGFGMMAPQQSRLAAMAPAQAPVLLSLNTSMLYLGTAGGAIVGGALASVLGFERLAWAGVPFVACGLVLLWLVPTLQASAPTVPERNA